ncbi:MAG: hypothetical protein K1000chlam2_00396 [Chlamydiae bacterium]|nr:hypothetical protein [Chlamydiota bacterium]
MTDFALLRIRNRPVLTLSSLYHRLVLFLFALFLVGGNFFRLFPLPPFPNHLSIVEIFLYALVLPRYFTRLRKSHFFIVGIVFSSLYGTILNGFDVTSVLYSAKLIAMIATGVVIGDILFQKFSPQQMMQYFIRIFVLIFLLGCGIFLFFPKAHIFFQFLDVYGVHFSGDPHQRRFISTFFDPNYYSAIACIPLILSWHLRKYSLFFLFLGSIFLSFSRSGIATCGFLLFFMLLSQMLRLKTTPFRWKSLYLGLLLIIPFCYSKELLYFLRRSIGLWEDPSALARLQNFQIGLSYFEQHPFFGIGYHYLSSRLFEDFGHLSLDSSLLITLTSFGWIPCLGLAIVGVVWSIKQLARPHSSLFIWLYIYVLVCILFTSQFNNLLYFQYWLTPIISLFTFMQKDKNEVRSRS